MSVGEIRILTINARNSQTVEKYKNFLIHAAAKKEAAVPSKAIPVRI